MLDGKTVLITGGTGSFGRRFVSRILSSSSPKKVIVYSRDEFKHYRMQNEYAGKTDLLRFFIGDVRDRDRLMRAFDGVDVVIHAAALKHVPLMEYNPIEAIRTNIYGAENVINAAIDRGVGKVVALSTDKAVSPVNLYGATKLVSDKLFIAANAYAGAKNSVFSVVRYGNVAGSRGSVVPFFKSVIARGEGTLPITDFRMTRFWITLDQAVDLVFKALQEAKGGEIFVPKIPSLKITDLASAMLQGVNLVETGIREGEKLHEVMITEEDSANTYEYEDHYVIYPRFYWWNFERHFKQGGVKVPERFKYSSDTNDRWLTIDEIRAQMPDGGLEGTD